MNAIEDDHTSSSTRQKFCGILEERNIRFYKASQTLQNPGSI